MIISLIAAMSENHVIGKDNDLMWRMPTDMKRFKSKTMGHHMIMGRKTFDSFGGHPLAGRTSIVLSRSKKEIKGAIVKNKLEDALSYCKEKGEKEVYIIGGAEIYKLALPLANKIYLTIIHHRFDGDTYFPDFDMKSWNETDRAFFPADEKNPYDYTFLTLER